LHATFTSQVGTVSAADGHLVQRTSGRNPAQIVLGHSIEKPLNIAQWHRGCSATMLVH
jgi:hypothetical protein